MFSSSSPSLSPTPYWFVAVLVTAAMVPSQRSSMCFVPLLFYVHGHDWFVRRLVPHCRKWPVLRSKLQAGAGCKPQPVFGRCRKFACLARALFLFLVCAGCWPHVGCRRWLQTNLPLARPSGHKKKGTVGTTCRVDNLEKRIT